MDATSLRFGDLELRPDEREALIDGRRVGLTVREFEVLHALAQRSNRVVPRPELYQLVWGGPMTYRDRSVDVFVRKVRRKLEGCAPGRAFIHTHFAVGYRFEVTGAS